MLNLPEILARPGSILLDNSLCRRSREGDKRSHLFQNPIRIIQCFVPSEVPGALAEIDKAVSDGLFAAGYLAYECGYELAGGRFGDATTVDWREMLGYPILWFGLYKEDVVLECGEVDKLLGVRTALSSGQADAPAYDANAGLCGDGITLTPTSDTTKFADAIHRIHELIHEGDLYQVNYTIRFNGELATRDSREDSLALFRHMRERQPVNYAAYLQLGDVQILSASPEQFFDRDGSSISVRPMKGTAPRGETSRLDAMLEMWLQTDEKNRSENLMILDLLRNDLSRVCTPGSVTADSLFEIEKYRSVIQMTSPVEGELNAGASYLDIFSALFPSGSITGAPKIRAMVRIRELESEPRGIYCGSIGFIDPAGRASFSVAIRTVSVSGREILTGSGGGIVWDSDAHEEYRECLLKTRYLGAEPSAGDKPVQLIESMICHGDIALIDRHLRRLERSTEALEFKFDRSVIVDSIEKHIGTLDSDIRFKVRLLLAANGTCSVTSESISADSVEASSDISATSAARSVTSSVSSSVSRRRPLRLGIASVTVHSGNPFLKHKTSFRSTFENARRTALENGLDEVLFLNENQQITEGTITNVFLRHGDLWQTPAVACGLLPGIGREIELESIRRPEEASLTVSDLRSADEIILTNAVRGRMRAEFVE